MDIDNLYAWSDDNFWKFSGRKCKYMIIYRRKQLSLPVTHLKIKQTRMEREHSNKYLGVWPTSTLCKSVRYAQKQGNKWVFYTESWRAQNHSGLTHHTNDIALQH